MKLYKNVMGGWLAPKPKTPPSTFDEIVLRAIMEHLEFHKNDGLELFIWATFAVTGDPLYTYPISAVNADAALEDAKRLHRMRGIPPSGDWKLLFRASMTFSS